MDHVDCVVVGAGVVGLAVANAFAKAGREVIILEAASSFGMGTSSRNSEVIHAGIYYTRGSLKAALCLRGRNLLYQYCEERGLAARRIGKFIVATSDEQIGRLADIRRAAEANGVLDLQFWSKEQLAQVEPQVRCVGALFSPNTGILDSHGYMLSLLGDFEAAGGWLARDARVVGIDHRKEGGFALSVDGDQPMSLSCDALVNAAGLESGDIAGMCAAWGGSINFPKSYMAKGSYFSLRGSKSPFSHLIYPVPVAGGLGTHATLDRGGQVRFGPDVQWIDTVDYTVDPSRSENFYPSIRAYWPDLPDGALEPAYAGIRPKIAPQGAPEADFRIIDQREHGVKGLIHLAGIESPGLTASLAIAELVRRLQEV